MYTEQLKYFKLAYELGSFSLAAEAVPISVQGLTKAMLTLEKELHVSLFVTNSQNIRVPTPYARALYNHILKWSNDYEKLKVEFERISAERTATIRVGFSLGVLACLSYEFFTTFAKEHPAITLSTFEANDKYIANLLTEGKIDFAFLTYPQKFPFSYLKLYSCPIYFWFQKKLFNPDKTEITSQDLSEHILAIPGKGFTVYDLISAEITRAGLTMPKVYTSSEIFMLYEFAHHYNALAFAVKHHLDLDVFQKDSCMSVLPYENHSWEYGIVWSHKRSLSNDMKLFLNYTRQYFRDKHAHISNG